MFFVDTAIISEAAIPRLAKKYTQTHLSKMQTYLDKWKLKANAYKTLFTWKKKNRDIQNYDSLTKR